jgi:hypothetical protein
MMLVSIFNWSATEDTVTCQHNEEELPTDPLCRTRQRLTLYFLSQLLNAPLQNLRSKL